MNAGYCNQCFTSVVCPSPSSSATLLHCAKATYVATRNMVLEGPPASVGTEDLLDPFQRYLRSKATVV